MNRYCSRPVRHPPPALALALPTVLPVPVSGISTSKRAEFF
ncbi:hypothetical protein CLOSTHATH_00065 [Hungatella hathewayi DSM 13479]|uniref:Uncharacterized protein n=1 Tax=Hungatella hathewayi DSM 13479 TaxID=566550 RepID=D3A8Z5_9FIRM|nr:hypothetical protein CLOSTHATH_00065 [Hungatella hathewayi DSM 13479]